MTRTCEEATRNEHVIETDVAQVIRTWTHVFGGGPFLLCCSSGADDLNG